MAKKSILFLAIALVAVVVVVLPWLRPTPPPRAFNSASPDETPVAPVATDPGRSRVPVPPTSPTSTSDGTSTGVSATDTAAVAARPPNLSAPGTTLNSSAGSASPSTESAVVSLEKTRRMIIDYHTLMGENPVGTNAEIMKALMGGNSRQAMLGPGDGQSLNAKGELIDPWGTPYFFHQLSGDHMEIHSAGPDKIMGTDDDLVLK